ncbi:MULTISPECIES: hypothetical protein [Bacillus]|uniref:hypothetical protein n=1 Tax=Bacillus TaxID=1386 RepID=UPI000309151F|nr:hypothetical protein [Bacillus altitudinis]MCY7578370.1 hypothetical protein [Bacillus altitudinis]MCY7596359.1 hypothetical protein [Bacillus altitudinis]QKL23518.1 hypothetical protein RI02_18025 [Bacillus altitudinis]QKL27250.1 hypothetical protein EQK04_18025 [Bacillus altitudinis]QXY97620.1 hypothetical protein G4D59_17840 [Bacillus altitudinis]
MVAIGLMLYGFIVQPLLSYGTVVLFLYGIIASFIGLIRRRQDVWMYVLRLLVCFTIPVTNLLMYFATIGGDERDFDFQPMPPVYHLVFILEIIIVFLPEILLIERKRSIKGKQWIYAGAIVGISVLFWCTI